MRRLAVQGRHDGDTRSDGRLDACECDDDHLDKFAYQSHFGTLISMHHPAEVPLRLGTSMTYLYDFGGRWACDVRLERIDPVDRTMSKARILDSYGEAPEQYPGTDDREA